MTRMKTYYLVPCSCGKAVEAERTQAGNFTVCACGKQVEIPPLRELMELETAQRHGLALSRDENLLGKTGGTRQRREGHLAMAGLLALLLAACAVYFYSSRPAPEDYSNYGAYECWQEWQRLRPGVDVPPTRAEYFMAHAIDTQWRWIYITSGLSILCVLWMLAVLLAPAGNRTRPPARE